MAIPRQTLAPHKVRRIEARLARQHPRALIAREEHVGRETVYRIERGEHVLQKTRAQQRPARKRHSCGALLITDHCLACELLLQAS